jgi:spore coat polysaccharide biosynthesis protein SpsF (cytidylyltransferase family)
MKNFFTAIIQARLGSTRFPNKVLNKLVGKTLIEILYNRLEKSQYLSNIIFAIPEQDIPLEIEIKKIGAEYYKGSEHDVLERFFRTAQHYQIQNIVRITADCPLIDPGILDRMIEIYSQSDYQYISNSLPPTFPDGFDIEIFSFQILKKTYHIATDDFDREHVTSFIRNNNEIIKYNYESEINHSHIRLTVDTPSDLELLKVLSEKIPDFSNISYKQVIDFIEENPELREINDNLLTN